MFLQFRECFDLHAREFALLSFVLSIFLRSFGRVSPGLLVVPLQLSGDGAGAHSEHLGYLFLLVSPDIQGLDAISVMFG